MCIVELAPVGACCRRHVSDINGDGQSVLMAVIADRSCLQEICTSLALTVHLLFAPNRRGGSACAGAEGAGRRGPGRLAKCRQKHAPEGFDSCKASGIS